MGILQIKLLLPLGVGVLVIIVTILVGMVFLVPQATIPSDIPEPEEVPIGALDSSPYGSIASARVVAFRSGYDLGLPHFTKDRSLISLQLGGVRPLLPDGNQLFASHVQMYYSKNQNLDLAKTSLLDLVAGGGFTVIVTDGSSTMEVIDNATPPTMKVSVGENPGMYRPPNNLQREPVIHLLWADGKTQYEIVASQDFFSLEDLIKIAESVIS